MKFNIIFFQIFILSISCQEKELEIDYSKLTKKPQYDVCSRSNAARSLIRFRTKKECKLVTQGDLLKIIYLTHPTDILDLGEFQERDLHGLSNMDVFLIQNTRMTSLPHDLLHYAPKLRTFSILQSNIKTIPSDLLTKSLRIEKFDFTNSPLENISKDLFRGEKLYLWGINFSRNKIKTISPTLFQDLPYIKTIALGGNLLTFLPSDLFKGTEKLSTLFLDNNLIQSIPNDFFQYTKGMRYISFYNNKLSKLPPFLFNNLNEVNTIYLGGNNFSQSAKVKIIQKNSRLRKALIFKDQDKDAIQFGNFF